MWEDRDIASFCAGKMAMKVWKRAASQLTSRGMGGFILSACIVALVCAVFLAIANSAISREIPLASLLLVVPAVPLLNYFFEILEYRAVGEAGWPVFSWETLVSPRRQISFVVLMIVAAAMVVRALLLSAGLVAVSHLFGFLVAVMLPVTVAVLAVTRRFSNSINPLFVLRAIVRLELGYIAVLAGTAVWWMIAAVAWSRGSFFLLFAAALVFLMLGWLIGTIVFAYRAQLGLRSRFSPEAKLAVLEQERRQRREHALGTAWVFASRGNIRGAIEHVRSYALEEDDAFAAETWLFHRMATWPDCAAAIVYAADLSARLSAANRAHQATKVDVMRETLERKARSSATID